nr:MAG: hypothetical protein [Mononegavirales sp.]
MAYVENPIVSIPFEAFIAEGIPGDDYLQALNAATGGIFTEFQALNTLPVVIYKTIASIKPVLRRLLTNVAIFYMAEVPEGTPAAAKDKLFGDDLDARHAFILHPVTLAMPGGVRARLVTSNGSREQSIMAHSLKTGPGHFSRIFPQSLNDYGIELSESIAIPDLSRPIETFVVVGTEDQLLSMMGSPGFPQQDRMATCFSAMFSYIVPWMREKLQMITYEDYVGMHPEVNIVELPATGLLKSHFYQVVMTQACLGQAYSTGAMMENQLFRRYKAACANMQIETMPEASFREHFNVFGREAFPSTPHSLELLGRVLAVDAEGQYNIQITAHTLCPLDTLSVDYHISEFSVGMLEQMRMVYAHSQHTSLLFGTAILPLIMNIFPKKGGDFDAQYTSAVNIQRVITEQLYIGMVRVLPEEHKIRNLALVVYTGVLYAKRAAVEEGAGETFDHFNIAGIAKHIMNPEDRNLCQAIASYLPMGGVVTLGALANFLTPDQVDLALGRREGVTPALLYQYLKVMGSENAWKHAYEQTLALNVLDTIETLQLPRMYANFDAIRDSLIASASRGGDHDLIADTTARVHRVSAQMRARVQAAVASAREALDNTPGRDHQALAPLLALVRNMIQSSATWSADTYGDIRDEVEDQADPVGE